ncbi:MAG: hypothetical protein QME81_16325 [bacterium]|nr:hypothetical protein [bacterium]
MRVKVDEDLPRAASQMLRDGGYEAVSTPFHLNLWVESMAGK